MSNQNEPGHGHSVAAWTSVVVMLVAFTIGTVAFWFEIVWLVWASVALLVVGAALWVVLDKLGLGEKIHDAAEKARH